ncbi:MAG: homoserine O-acetyltransferase [Chitinophagaceae bacterium]|nr:MAG: homoserine O-acetyltransferase [Chitinophagaceae bacterium]
MPFSVFNCNDSLTLESGTTLSGFHLGYTTFGTLNASGDNVIWIFHALTANSDPTDWWPGLVGEGKLFDPADYFIVCVNMPGSCYGSISPLDVKSGKSEIWYHDFPLFTPRDMIRCYQPLRRALGINKIKIGLGGSMGGQQLLEWAIEEPALFEYIIPIATNAAHSPWGIAFNASQRLAIEMDSTWKEKDAAAGITGMKVARGFALISYRHYTTYGKGQTEHDGALLDGFKSESYQRYQGEKLAKRFNAFSYYFLSKSMDSHNVARSRGSAAHALGSITAKTLSIAIETDILFPPEEQKFIADNIPGAQFTVIQSPYGHDGFLLEFDQLEPLIRNFAGMRPAENLTTNKN